MNSKSSRRQGFTLIELLVVVAIIAMLVAILMPSLKRARDEAREIKCAAQLKEIGNVMHMYFMEHNNWFPFEKRNELNYIHGFYYGGHPGRRVAPGSPEWWGFVRDEWRDTPAGRPFNPYLYPDLPNWDFKWRDNKVLFKQVRDDLVLFQCPSDLGGFWNTQTGDLESEKPIHWTTGSSYDFNYHFVLRWAINHRQEPRWLQLGNAFLSRQLEFHSSRFVMIFEDPFDSGQWNNIPRRGWHQQWNQHNFLFLDGHAANMFADATNGNRGPGWKTAAGRWYNDPEDPDYEYRDLRP